ncbi:hypothetical protein LINPERPRIM_LOCUS37780 [Linum perenne]
MYTAQKIGERRSRVSSRSRRSNSSTTTISDFRQPLCRICCSPAMVPISLVDFSFKSTFLP